MFKRLIVYLALLPVKIFYLVWFRIFKLLVKLNILFDDKKESE